MYRVSRLSLPGVRSSWLNSRVTNGLFSSSASRLDETRPSRPASLVLADGTRMDGISFGAEQSKGGEVVFTTGMTGYPESLSDPSFQGQILNFTYPMIGNYGVPSVTELDEYGLHKNIESNRIHAAGVICQDYSHQYSHWNAEMSLGDWLKKEGIPGICGIDSRLLTQKIRDSGSMLGRIVIGDEAEVEAAAAAAAAGELDDPNQRHLVAEVSRKEVQMFGVGNPIKILAVDCGIKNNIVRHLVQRGAEVKLVPWDHDLMSEVGWYDGLFLSNGPGDPAMCEPLVEQLKQIIALEGDAVRPIFGICLGNQLVGRAAGASTYKMPFGNRGHNVPVQNKLNGRCYITPQNHGYALEGQQLPDQWKQLFVNTNDGTNEGIMHTSKPYFTAQFHPEAMGGPTDTEFLFDSFIKAVVEKQRGAVTADAAPPAVPRTEVKKVLLLGSGGLSIGQAGEFDYSGSQAIKALKEEGVQVVLMNPNIASVQTNVDGSTQHQADNVYFLPVNAEFVEEVIKRERPDGIVVSMGGQTGLNVGVDLYQSGVLEKYGVQVLGTPIESVMATEDREIFSDKLNEIGEKIATSEAVAREEGVGAVLAAGRRVGLPCMIRSAYSLGGLGSGICDTEEQLAEMARKAFAVAPQVLVERSLRGWKEVEYEVVRDCNDNCITVCNMENFDPLGVHTGDSIVVAPSQTLSNREYHMLRTTAINVVRHLGIVGECNIQYALDPKSEDYCIIEVNARLSRSSALASKATGYPLAFVAAKLSLGLQLPDIRNSVTKSTSACFEPALDYVVAKVPRWDLAKFDGVSKDIGSQMKSVGEVMAIGRTFEESMQKALRMTDPSYWGFWDHTDGDGWNCKESLEASLRQPNDRRVLALANALMEGRLSVDDVHDITAIDPWFLDRLQRIATSAQGLKGRQLSSLPPSELLDLKQQGFSDRQLASLLQCTEEEVRGARVSSNIRPWVKQIDTLAAEVPAATNYLYMTYHGGGHDLTAPAAGGGEGGDQQGVMVLGSGAYRIGSSVEFDWCAVSCLRELRALGRRSVMLNYNPETVSTDYDECDALYFEELSEERVRDIYEREGVEGVVVSVGGQIPNNLAMPLHKAGVKVLGTSPERIDNAEDRFKFSQLMDKIGVKQPDWKELRDVASALEFAKRVGYPVLVRPSYVLSGAAMNVAWREDQLTSFLAEAAAVSAEHPVVVTKFVEGAKELEVDAVARDGVVVSHAISEHVENAGVHSGDATLVLPPQDTSPFYMDQVKEITRKVAEALEISGPFNMQFLAKGADVSVIECNLRASRSLPFVSKTVGVDFVQAATKVMLDAPTDGMDLPDLSAAPRPSGYCGVKAPMTSYSRLAGADPLVGVEMASTGEVACFGADKNEAFLKAMVSTGFKLPNKNILISMQERHSEELVHYAYDLTQMRFKLFATDRTHAYLKEYGVESTHVDFPDTPTPSDSSSSSRVVTDLLKEGGIDLVVNLPTSESTQIENNYLIRRCAVDFAVPLITNIKLVELFVNAMTHHKTQPLLGLKPRSLFEYYQEEPAVEAWTKENEFH